MIYLTCPYDNGTFAPGVPLKVKFTDEYFVKVEWEQKLLNSDRSEVTYRAEIMESFIDLEDGYAPCSPFACPLD